jgi:hypothetical protein
MQRALPKRGSLSCCRGWTATLLISQSLVGQTSFFKQSNDYENSNIYIVIRICLDLDPFSTPTIKIFSGICLDIDSLSTAQLAFGFLIKSYCKNNQSVLSVVEENHSPF